jgi:RNA polymerase-binding transcription factor DksA
MDEQRARALVARERRRIEAALAELAGEEQDDDASHFDQTGEADDSGTDLQHEMTDQAAVADLQAELESVVRAEARIARGTFGLSVDSGARIPDDRLEAEPLAERTFEEQVRFERSQG